MSVLGWYVYCYRTNGIFDKHTYTSANTTSGMPVQNIILGADKIVRNATVERYVSVTQHASML